MWGEGSAYTKNSIYKIGDSLPPVNYDAHLIKAHSITHFEAPSHTIKGGRTIETFFENSDQHFYGRVSIIRLKGDSYQKLDNGVEHWEITVDEILEGLNAIGLTTIPSKLFITTESYTKNEEGYHDPRKVLTLTQAAASYLVSFENFKLYGTSWKSSDFKPGSSERPIHNTLFKQALILENLDLSEVPEGEYFLSALPIALEGASESPVTPIVFTYDELIKY